MPRPKISEDVRSSDTATPTTPITTTRTASLVEETGFLRGQVRVLTEDTSGLHRKALRLDLEARTAERKKLASKHLLEALANLGFAWRDVARVLHVSVPAVRKWRLGDSSSPENRERLARVLAVCDVLTEVCLVQDVASWFEMRLLPEVPVTPMDLLAEDREDLVLAYASQHDQAEHILGEFDPEWQRHAADPFEVYEAPDGVRSVRMRSGF